MVQCLGATKSPRYSTCLFCPYGRTSQQVVEESGKKYLRGKSFTKMWWKLIHYISRDAFCCFLLCLFASCVSSASLPLVASGWCCYSPSPSSPLSPASSPPHSPPSIWRNVGAMLAVAPRRSLTSFLLSHTPHSLHSPHSASLANRHLTFASQLSVGWQCYCSRVMSTPRHIGCVHGTLKIDQCTTVSRCAGRWERQTETQRCRGRGVSPNHWTKETAKAVTPCRRQILSEQEVAKREVLLLWVKGGNQQDIKWLFGSALLLSRIVL